MKTDELYQNTDNIIISSVSDKETGETVPASSFFNAQYLLVDVTGTVKINLQLGSGIEVVDDVFVIRIGDELLNNSFRGPHTHQLVAWNSAGDKLPPLFQNKVEIIPVYTAPLEAP